MRVDWPNISVRSATNQYVYERSFLYLWNGKQWVQYRVSPWYVGISNVYGSQALGHTLVFNLPYYFALPGHPSLVLNNVGEGFNNLPHRFYYKTLEQYSYAGHVWSKWQHVHNTNYTSCLVL